jgi:hypothetical protein
MLSKMPASTRVVPVMPRESHLHFVEAEIARDGSELGGRHQTTCGDHREHHVENPEQWSAQHFAGLKAARRLVEPLVAGAGISQAGRFQERRERQNDQALGHAEIKEGCFVAIGVNGIDDCMTVAAAPAPKPPAVNPAAKPRDLRTISVHCKRMVP